jgi:hypothetical protein
VCQEIGYSYVLGGPEAAVEINGYDAANRPVVRDGIPDISGLAELLVMVLARRRNSVGRLRQAE